MAKAALAAGLLLVMAGAWYVALWGRPPLGSSSRPASPPVRSPSSTGPALDVHLERLTRRDTPSRPDTMRDPFARRVVEGPAARADGPAASPVRAPGTPAGQVGETVSAWPSLQLIGVAESRDGGAVVRTAILSSAGGVHHARPGELLERVYRVERIGADGVDVRLVPEDRLVHLSLRP